MAISVKKEPLYPSITKPGIFYYDNENETLWEGYTGIDNSEFNRFKFAIGSWKELSAQNRRIRLVPNVEMDFVSSGLDDDSGEGKPSEPPIGWTPNTEESIEALGEFGDAKPPSKSKDMTGRYEAMFKHPYFISEPRGLMAGNEDVDPSYYEGARLEGHYAGEQVNTISPFRPKYMISENDSNASRGIVKEKYWADHFGLSTVFTLGLNDSTNRELRVNQIGFHSEATSASPKLKLSTPGKGYWKASIDDITLEKDDEVSVGEFFGGLYRAVTRVVTANQAQSPGGDRFFKYDWKPNLHAFQRFNREGSYSTDFEWIWQEVEEGEGFEGSNYDWVRLPSIIFEPEYQSPLNTFVGVPIVSNETPQILNGLGNGLLRPKNLPVFHPPDSENYTNTTAPLKLNFGIDLFELDLGENFGSNKFKFHVLEWGDEDLKLSNEDILNSEFFSLYNVDADTFDKSQAKKLLQVVSNSKYYKSYGSTQYPENETLNFYEHTYTDSGVYSIKTIIFRIDNEESMLLETILLNTNIVVNDAGESIQDFNIFGSSDFSVLPLSTEDKELIIGGISDQSKYVNSLKKIERDDLYGPKDYLEKKYSEKFLPKVTASLYGDHPGKLDLSTTRIFTKPYDLSYFIEPISEDENRSRATDILIDNNDCIIEINPNEIDRSNINNSGLSDDRIILIGDYKLIKEENLDIRKEENMDVPKIENSNEAQAI